MTGADLAARTTLRLGGPAARLIEAETDEDVIAAVSAADANGEPVLVLGGGSNVVIGDAGFPGTVAVISTSGVRITPAGDVVLAEVSAGENWDQLTAWAVAERLRGIECLAGIPGLAGATPVQNVGAYGQEVGALIEAVRVYDRELRALRVLTAGECGFGYRSSVFKRTTFSPPARAAAAQATATGRYVVLGVSLRLRCGELSEPVRYGELAGRLGIGEGGRAPLGEVREAVLALRRGKGMVLDPADPDSRSAGSFFTNPVLTRDHYEDVVRRVNGAGARGGGVPCYPAGEDRVKIPAAWLIEHAGFGKGYPAHGLVRISSKHTLALTTRPGATTSELIALAREIVAGVRTAFGVELSPEPILIGADF